jgi:hypothetical protein
LLFQKAPQHDAPASSGHSSWPVVAADRLSAGEDTTPSQGRGPDRIRTRQTRTGGFRTVWSNEHVQTFLWVVGIMLLVVLFCVRL